MNQVSHFFGPVEFLSALDVALIALLILKRTMSGLYKIMLVLFILISVAFGILHKNGNELDHASSTYGPVQPSGESVFAFDDALICALGRDCAL